jgi:hypothetical protein
MNEEDIYKNIRIGSNVSIIHCTRNKDTGDISVTYDGTDEGLVATGLVTLQSLAPRGPDGKRRKRIDSAGFPFGFRSWSGRADTGRLYRVYRITFHRPAVRIAELPGASEALAVHDASEAARAAGET